jgi:hypothetical protein
MFPRRAGARVASCAVLIGLCESGLSNRAVVTIVSLLTAVTLAAAIVNDQLIDSIPTY